MSLFNLLFGKKEQPVENNPTSAEPLAEPQGRHTERHGKFNTQAGGAEISHKSCRI